MALQKAIDFIINLKHDKNLRNKMNRLNAEQVHPFLEANGYYFTFDQFEDAINYYKLRCENEQEAFDMDEIKFWFTFLTTVFERKKSTL